MFSCKRRCATFAKYSRQEPMVQFSTIVFCVQELSSIAKRNKQEGFLMICPNRKKRVLWYFSNSLLEFLFC